MAILQEDPPALSDRAGASRPSSPRSSAHCLEKSPEERFQSARDLAFALRVLEREAARSGPAGSASRSAARAAAARTRAGFDRGAAVPQHERRTRDAEYFSDGMTEEIINALSRIEALHVASRTSAFAFKGKDDGRPADRPRRSACGTVLEGSVRQAGRRIRITAQLIDVADGYHLWSERYDREMEDVFAVQDEIARRSRRRSKVRLLPAEEARARPRGRRETSRRTTDYLKGRYFFNQRAAPGGDRGVRGGRWRAIPRTRRPTRALADSYCIWGFYGGISTLEAFARARAAAEKAQELEPDSRGRARRARHRRALLRLGHRTRGAGAAPGDRARPELGRGATPGWRLSGRHPALRTPKRSSWRGRPWSSSRTPPTSTNAGWPHFFVQRYDLAIDGFRKALEVDSSAVYALWALGMACQAAGRHEEGISALEKLSVLTGREMPWSLCLLSSSLATSGRVEAARAVLAEIEGLAGSTTCRRSTWRSSGPASGKRRPPSSCSGVPSPNATRCAGSGRV